MAKVITPQMARYFEQNYLQHTRKEMAAKFGIPKGTVQSFLKKRSLHVPKELAKQRRIAGIIKQKDDIPHDHDETIQQLYLKMPVKQLAKHINKSNTYVKGRLDKLNLVIPRELIDARKKAYRIKPGATPPNKGRKQTEYMSADAIERTKKGRFKAGEPNHNELHDGTVTMRHDHAERPNSKPHYHIRIAKGKWKELQIYNWEKINGPIPKGYILACQDGNTLNCDPANWKLMTKADNARRNAGHVTLSDHYIAYTIAGKKHKDLIADILKNPELIEIKRTQLLLKKTIRKHDTTSNTGKAEVDEG